MEPREKETYYTVDEITKMFVGNLVNTAQAFLGTKVTGVVIVVSSSWSSVQRKALAHIVEAELGVKVLQILDEASASLALTTSPSWIPEAQEKQDRLQLVVDIGHSSLSLHLIQVRKGLGILLNSSTSEGNGGAKIDELLLAHFSKDFTKKTKIALSLPLSSSSPPNAKEERTQQKLLLALHHTKLALSASSASASVSVESLKEGMDYTGSINRMRFDMVVGSVYKAVEESVRTLLKNTDGVESWSLDEVVRKNLLFHFPWKFTLSDIGVHWRNDITPRTRRPPIFIPSLERRMCIWPFDQPDYRSRIG